MLDPVIDTDGNSYEKKGIEDWNRRNGTSPITHTPLSINDLNPNQALKISIDEYHHSLQPNVKSNLILTKQHSPEIKVSTSHTNDLVHISIQPP
ncbi:unnamed protein product, partial [Rotaria sp. Silwood2]